MLLASGSVPTCVAERRLPLPQLVAGGWGVPVLGQPAGRGREEIRGEGRLRPRQSSDLPTALPGQSEAKGWQ